MKIIAESAFNHQGSFENLLSLAKASNMAGADFFTFQMMHVDSFCVSDYHKYELYKSTEFSESQWRQLISYCRELQMDIIPCVLDHQSLRIAIDESIEKVKIHATDISNFPLLKEIASSNIKSVFLETQCATMLEVKMAIDILGADKIEALFSGYSNYPSEQEELNLNSVDYLRSKFDFKIGFADHSIDRTEIPLMLLAKGCSYLEKHITLGRNQRNYDWQVSLNPTEFRIMIDTVNHYWKALGYTHKHPSMNEKLFRPIMYKRVLEGESELKRSDDGNYPIERLISEIKQEKRVGVAIIARLKSERLKRKVLLDLGGEKLVIALYKRINKAKKIDHISLCTSDLYSDDELVEIFENSAIPVFRGDADSVIDRMLDFAVRNRLGFVFRVTGDNPLTDPILMDEMVKLMQDNDLDYVKVNGVPFGIGAELFSIDYLWKLYLSLETTTESEYLSWYVQHDNTCKMGAVNVESDLLDFDQINLSVDYQEDYDLVNLIIKSSSKNVLDVELTDIKDLSETLPKVDITKSIKLPKNQTVVLSEYLDTWKSISYTKIKTITL